MKTKLLLIACLLLLCPLCWADSDIIVDGWIVDPHIVQEEGTSLTPRPYLNFVGTAVTAADAGGKTVVTITGGGAPTDADYLVGTANGSLSAEIVVGTTPGGELGGTWAAPTIDDSVAVSSWTLTTPIITNGATFTDADISPNAAGELVYDNTVTGLADGAFAWYDDDAIRYIVDLATLPVDDDFVVAYDADNDLFYMKQDADTGGSTAYDDIGDPDAAGSISFDNNETATYTSAEDDGAFFHLTLTDADLSAPTTVLKLSHADNDDDSGIFLQCYDDSAGDNDLVFQIGAAGKLTIGEGATDWILPTARGTANQILADSGAGAGAIQFRTLADIETDPNVDTADEIEAILTNDAIDFGTGSVTCGNLDVEGYAAFGDGSALSALYTLVLDRDFASSAASNMSQLMIGGDMTADTFAPGTCMSFAQIGTTNIGGLEGPSCGMTADAVSPPVMASLALYEPNITEVNGGVALLAATLYIKDAPTEGTSNFAIKVDAGNVEFDEDLTIGGGNLNTGNVAFTIGDGTTDNITFSTDGTGDGEIVLPDGSISGTEILDGTIAVADTAITAGRSLTWSTNDMVADAELYTDSKTLYFEDPTADDDFQTIWYAKQAATITHIYAESDQTVTFNLQRDDGTPADIATADLAPAAGNQTACASGCTTTLVDAEDNFSAGDRMDLKVTSVSGTPTWVSITFTLAYDD